MTERQVAWTTFLNNEPYLYQEHRSFFAQVAHPIEEMAGEELAELGATNVDPQYRGVQFSADAESLRRIVYCARIPTRVMAPLMTFDCHSDKYLYKRACEMDWMSLIGVSRTFAIFATVSHSRITHSKYAALKLKDAIVDTIRNEVGSRPDVDRHDPDVSINLHIDNNRATVSIDVAGRSMHRRGYRLDSLEAPLQETVAAAIIRMSGWKGDVPLLDPMCGSGTILAEAMMAAANIPSGILHDNFGFQQLPDHDAAAWKAQRVEIDAAIKPVKQGLISGSDIESEAVKFARRNLARLPHGNSVSLTTRDFNDIESFKDGVIITNPPYGLRIGHRNAIQPLFKGFGDFLKQRCTNSTAYIYVGKPELLKLVGLRTKWKRELVNGALEGRLAKYELY
ncbi:MAG: THUMP domain-containing protein [Bacteroidetes bacterium]|nr:THUMP domain-containing protein [Bacteroidota bacterium]